MEGDGIYVVMAGLIKSSYQTPDDDTQVCARLYQICICLTCKQQVK